MSFNNEDRCEIQNGHVTTDCLQNSAGESPDNRQALTASGAKPRETWGKKLEFLLTAVGFAVGLGNVWRFPHLCYKNGGGAFLIPYLIMLIFVGLPLFYLELAWGQYASLGPLTIWRLCPLFKGVGYAMFTISILISIYYNVLISYTLFYLFASFQSPLPWSDCDNWWNTKNCGVDRPGNDFNRSLLETEAESNISLATDVNNVTVRREVVSPAQEYWEYRVLGLKNTTDISNIGHLQWHVTLCLVLSWIIVFLCIIKGIKSSGKVAYFTATFPYVVLFILFIRGVTLDGATLGITYYIKPDFGKMSEVMVWKEAAVQVLYSLGVGSGSVITMASYNKFNNNCQRDAVIISLINSMTSIFAGFVIFSVLGHMAYVSEREVSEVARQVGPGLAFVVYPEGLALMSGAPFWSVSFFFMLFTLGLGSQFVGIECLITGVIDEFPVLYKRKLLVTASFCFCLFLAGLPCVTEGGMYVLDLFDKFSTAFPLLFTVFFEVIVLNWIYGFKRFKNDIEHMIGYKPNYYWIACWIVLTPSTVMFILVFSCIQYDGITLEGYRYPSWAEGVGWILSLLSLVCIPAWMIIVIVQHIRSKNVTSVLCGYESVSSLKLKDLISPRHEWGPALEENRLGYEPGLYGHLDEHSTDSTTPNLSNVFYEPESHIVIDGTTYGTDSYI